jgi:hypothetical protein
MAATPHWPKGRRGRPGAAYGRAASWCWRAGERLGAGAAPEAMPGAVTRNPVSR